MSKIFLFKEGNIIKNNKFLKNFIKEARFFIKKVFKKNKISLELYLVNDQKIIEINKRTRGKDYAANVLSFSLETPMGKHLFLGEIVLNIDFINRKYKKPLDGTIFLFIHGLLHILGYVHDKKSDRIIMESLEDRFFQKWKDLQKELVLLNS